jgi:hypothetical protein
MIEPETIIALLPSIGACVGVWVHLNSKVDKLKGRVYHLEADRDELKGFMREVREALTDIHKIIAAK